MEVREAVSIAKNWVKEILADENVSNVGLEEIEHDERQGVWHVTIGFSRPWNASRNSALSAIVEAASQKRAYRVITVREPNGEVLSMKRRESDLG
jgi:hypothetical protein